MRGDRNLIQHNIGRGQHIFRQCRGHPGADAVEIDADIGGSVAARGGCHVAHQTLAQPRQVANHHNGLPDRRVDRDGRCYVTEFDSESANLDLLVGTAHELDVTVSIAARQIPGPVHAGTGIKRVGNESLRGQPGAAMVSVCDMRPSNIDLADHTGRTGCNESSSRCMVVLILGRPMGTMRVPCGPTTLNRLALITVSVGP